MRHAKSCDARPGDETNCFPCSSLRRGAEYARNLPLLALFLYFDVSFVKLTCGLEIG